MSYQFGKTVAGSWIGCPKVDEENMELYYSDIRQKDVNIASQKNSIKYNIYDIFSKNENVLPRSLS